MSDKQRAACADCCVRPSPHALVSETDTYTHFVSVLTSASRDCAWHRDFCSPCLTLVNAQPPTVVAKCSSCAQDSASSQSSSAGMGCGRVGEGFGDRSGAPLRRGTVSKKAGLPPPSAQVIPIAHRADICQRPIGTSRGTGSHGIGPVACTTFAPGSAVFGLWSLISPRVGRACYAALASIFDICKACVAQSSVILPFWGLVEYCMLEWLQDEQLQWVVDFVQDIPRGKPLDVVVQGDFYALPNKVPHGPIVNSRPLLNFPLSRSS